ncbi:(2Fe-2S)-binding protein [Streptomyces sp. NPDC001315]|uniref:(2Fe-2S)-binding protein n=1 Tax=Streptomyces sp. NPDC001315 TaxID=3364562 RepID=UPI0036849724
MVLLLVVDFDLDSDLAALRPLGGFFVLRTAPGRAGAPSGPSATLPTLGETYANRATDVHGDSLSFRVRTVTRSLRAAEVRVGASVAHQALAARLWSVALGCAALYGGIPDLDPGLLRWDAGGTAPDDLWLPEVRPLPGDAATVAQAVLDAHLRPLTAAVQARYRVAAGLLWGNAGSALAGAARELDGWARANGRTDVGTRACSLTAELFDHPLLAGSGIRTGTAFRRRSCCLYYRVPGGGVCGDCCFTRPPRSSPRDPSG